MSANAPDPGILASFLDEAGQCIITLNEKLLLVEQGGVGDETIGEMFRAAHSMKGMAGFLNLTRIGKVTHHLETVLDKIRKKELEFTPEAIDALFQGLDTISTLLADLAGGAESDLEIQPVLTLLESVLGEEEKEVEGDPEKELGVLPDFLCGRLDLDDILETMIARNAGRHIYCIRFSLRELFDRDYDPVQVYRQLSECLEIRSMIPLFEANTSAWLPLDEYDYHVVALCYSKTSLSDAVPSGLLPPCEAWELCITPPQQTPLSLGRDEAAFSERTDGAIAVRSDMEKHKSTWLSETHEELESLDTSLLAYEQAPQEREHLHEIFRMMHRIKSSAAAMGLAEMSRVAHNCESLLSRLRETEAEPTETIFQALYAAKDILNACHGAVESGESNAPATDTLDAQLQMAMQTSPSGAGSKASSIAWEIPAAELEKLREACPAGTPAWKIIVALDSGTPLADLRYSMILRNLDQAGQVISSTPTIGELEAGLEHPDPLRVVLSGVAEEETIREICSIDMVTAMFIESLSLGDSSAATKDSPAAGAQTPTSAAKGAGKSAPMLSDTVRVDTARLDFIMNTAGELAISKAQITQLVNSLLGQFATADWIGLELILRQMQNKEQGTTALSSERLTRIGEWVQELKGAHQTTTYLRDATLGLHRHCSTLQNSVMQIRMVPIGPLFQRFHRLIRDLCKQGDRKARLVTRGEGTELDKKLIDELADPLTHLIRNAVDHGLESPEDRAQNGKEEEGTIMLEAFHEGGQICVRVEDNGRGLSLEKIKEKAVRNGLMSEEEVARLSEADVYQLIFRPGFSTAAKITNISGRGVGMDIVKSKVVELKGKIDIESTPGEGARFTIRLPLTLAMMESLLVKIGSTKYAFPLESVYEIVEFSREQMYTVEGRGKAIFLRQKVITVLDLSQTLDVDPLALDGDLLRAVIIHGNAETFAILVDQVCGDEEIVVKALPEEVSGVKGVSGATVLGTGEIALILDAVGIEENAHDTAASPTTEMEDVAC